MARRVIFHVDANSAFLSWSAAYRVMVLGEKEDLRDVPSVVAGDKENRHGIILAKSTPAKKYGIHTGEPLFQALEKCPQLRVVAPDYELYVEVSRHFVALLREFSPVVEQYSIDEAWVDMSGTELLYGSPMNAAHLLRQRVGEELGFTVNVGVSSNKLLAKMAGDFSKPNQVHSCFPDEIGEKLWPLPVRELFMVGPATERKLRRLGILTIGQLAQTELPTLTRLLGKQGQTIWNFANGRNTDSVLTMPEDNKGYGNSVTTAADVTTRQEAYSVLLSLCETVGMRMRRDGKSGSCVTVHLRNKQFENYSHQKRMHNITDRTTAIFEAAREVFDEMWDGQDPLRQLGVQVTRLCDEGYCQYDFFTAAQPQTQEKILRLDATVDGLRDKYGEGIVRRGRFLRGGDHMAGGLSKVRRTGITKPVAEK